MRRLKKMEAEEADEAEQKEKKKRYMTVGKTATTGSSHFVTYSELLVHG